MNSGDLEKRTVNLSKNIIDLTRTLEVNSSNAHISFQLLRASTSIGANYREALEAESKKDFIHKLGICKKEAKESLYWLELLSHDNKLQIKRLRILWKETRELLLIFSKTVDTTKKNMIMNK